MFTGIVEHLAQVEHVTSSEPVTITIERPRTFTDLKPGDSVAVDGTCLTVTSLTDDLFCVQVLKESLHRTNLSRLRHGSQVGLERSVTPTTRMGGHFVQGHVDTICRVTFVEVDSSTARWLTLQPEDPTVMKYIVAKGYVTLSGASITVVDTTERAFRVMLIPYTQGLVSFGDAKAGDTINLEVDILAKYIESLHKTQS